MLSRFREGQAFQFVIFLIFIVVVALAVFISGQKTNDRQHAAGTNANITIDFTSIIQHLDPKEMGMDISGYYSPNPFAGNTVEQQKLKLLGVKYLRMDLIYSTSGDPTSKIICGANG